MLTNAKKYFIITIVLGVITISTFVAYTILQFLGVLADVNLGVSYGIVTFMLILLGLLFVFMIRYVHAKMELDNLKLQNEHSFGSKKIYFNRVVFEDVVNSYRRKSKYRNGLQTMIAFTAISGNISLNNNRRQSFMELNKKVIDYLAEYFKKFANDHIYCFDEGVFYVYCFGDNRIQIISMVNDINDAIYNIMEKNNIHILVSPNFGIDEVKPSETLLEAFENANISRKTSENNFEMFNFYQKNLRDVESIDDASKIIDALEKKEFEVYYQPKFNPIRGVFVSSEALIRWNSSTMGVVMPGTFIPLANAAGLSHELDVYVFTKVLEDLRESKKKGRRILPVSLNFSLYEFYSSNFLDFILDSLKKYEIDPRMIQIEILETTSQANPFLSISIIKKLREMGIRVLMDDFGIGYSNISNLSKMPFDAIKIDKQYVDNITKSNKDKRILECLVNLGQINGLEVVCEGVDNKQQADMLYQMGCDTIQGFYYSKPLKKEDYDKFLIKNPFEGEENL
jgi:EAL domain-containing protein (putative c-di-GMP-specific phosphodiesterase class I)